MTDYEEVGGTRLPGWVAVREPGSTTRKYMSPSGDIVGSWAFSSAKKHWERTGVVPQEPLGTSWKKHQKSNATSSSTKHPNKDEEVFELPIPGTDEVIPIELPEPRNTTASHRRSGLFTSKELSTGFQSIFVIATSIVAMATSVPGAQMTDLEVKSVSIPLGNIVERSNYNKVIGQLVVDKSDWLQLGYALYMYTYRVSSEIRETKSVYQPTGNAQQNKQSDSAAGINGTRPSVFLRPTSEGIRNIIRGY